MYNEFNTDISRRAQSASEINIRVHDQEKKMALLKALYHMDATGQSEPSQKKSHNPFRALLGIFLASF
jgi:hypothetical protein